VCDKEQAQAEIFLQLYGKHWINSSRKFKCYRGETRDRRGKLCKKYGIKLQIIENFHASGQEDIGHQLVDSLGSRFVDEDSSVYKDNQIIHI